VIALLLCGWLCAAFACWRMWTLGRRLELVACAEHELRGPLAALTLAAARSRPLETHIVEGQLERARLALADLTEARRGRRAAAQPCRHEAGAVAGRVADGWAAAGGEVSVDWQASGAVVDADPARVSQALGNLLSNALEHGGGRVRVLGRRHGRRVRIEIADGGGGFAHLPRPGRGRGLAIAARAIDEAGGQLRIVSGPEGTVASIELPLADP
jgi:signal transduction histidine kinase